MKSYNIKYFIHLYFLSIFTSLTQSVITYIDSDTPEADRTIVRYKDGVVLQLVMSDEFQEDGRGFGPNEDPIFEAINSPDTENSALEYCK
jgi:hypothetical protein